MWFLAAFLGSILNAHFRFVFKEDQTNILMSVPCLQCISMLCLFLDFPFGRNFSIENITRMRLFFNFLCIFSSQPLQVNREPVRHQFEWIAICAAATAAAVNLLDHFTLRGHFSSAFSFLFNRLHAGQQKPYSQLDCSITNEKKMNKLKKRKKNRQQQKSNTA